MYTEQVEQKLLAFEKFLERHPEWHGQVRGPALWNQHAVLDERCLGCIDSSGFGYDGGK
jgi:hypothetical protein